MLSLTAKFCVNKLPPRISTLLTVTVGRVNFGVTSEQAPSTTHTASAENPDSRNKVLLSRGNIEEMIPIFARQALTIVAWWASAVLANPPPGAPVQTGAVECLATGDGYLRAKLAGAIEARIDWPNSGTHCEGESREKPPGVRLSFQRASGAAPNLLLVFGLNGVREGQSAREVKVNLTVIMQGTSRIFGTLGDSRCTVDSLTQRALKTAGSYRLEARGFCTQPAHAVRGKGDVLVSTFDFAGPVTFHSESDK
jgi:hypothetical protein